jgi:uncharacterized membrane protein
MDTWWNKPLFGVTLELAGASDLRSMDVKSLVRKLIENGVNLIVAFSLGYWPGGTSFYQSRIAPHHPDLNNRDFLAEIIEEAHKHNVKVVSYANVLWGNREMYLTHPEWAQRKLSGAPVSWDVNYTSVAMCPNTPYRDYIIKVVKEIAENYDVDGFYFDEASFQSWCSCSTCKKLFKEETNLELPMQENWGDPAWNKFISWRYQKITEFRKLLYRAAKKDNIVIFFQHPFPLAFWPLEALIRLEKSKETLSRYSIEIARWYIPLTYGSDLEEVSKFEDIIHMELYRKSVGRPLWWYGICIKLARAINEKKPILILNMQGNQPFDLTSLPDSELRLAIGEIIANGGSPLFALYYPDLADPNGWQTIFDQFKTLRNCEEYLVERESVKFAALLYSRKTIDLFDSHEEIKCVNELMGFSKALLQSHIPFDIITEDGLKNAINQYQVLILPNVACLSDDDVALIKKFVQNGGGLVASYRTSIYDMDGKKREKNNLDEVFGIKSTGEEKRVFTTDSYMLIKYSHPVVEGKLHRIIPSFGTQLIVKPAGSSRVISTLVEESPVHYAPLGPDTNLPTIVVNEYLNGRTVYFAGPIGSRYLEFSLPVHKMIICNSVIWTSREEAPLISQNCPEIISIIPWYQRRHDRYVIHLVSSIRDEVELPITYVSECRDIIIRLRIKAAKNHFSAKEVFPTIRPLNYELKNEWITFRIPEVKEHSIVIIE